MINTFKIAVAEEIPLFIAFKRYSVPTSLALHCVCVGVSFFFNGKISTTTRFNVFYERLMFKTDFLSFFNIVFIYYINVE